MRKTFYKEADQVLVENCLNGQSQAQYDLYQKYGRGMYNVVVRMVNNSADAEDIIQEVFVKVFRSLGSFNGESTLGAWIKRITVNTTLNFLRKSKHSNWMSIEDGLEVPDFQEDKEVSRYSMKQIHYAIKQLPEKCRVVVSLFLIEGYQHKEIAQILKITESTSKTQYRRGRQLLKGILKP